MRAHEVFNRIMIAGRIVCLMLISAGAAAGASYTNDTNWGGANLTLYDGDVIAGVHSNIGHFAVAPGATVTVQPHADGVFGRATIFAASADIQGTLSADVAGHPAEEGGGAGTRRCGGSYGGRGGLGSEGRYTEVYGSPVAPVDMGSGAGLGGHAISTGGAGGGALKIEVTGALTVDGSLSARGQDGTYRAGGGSGGSIWLKAASIAGNGVIAADGGTGSSGDGGGGGGGRIAFDTPENLFVGTLRARGGLGGGTRGLQGKHGTFNLKPDPTLDLTITADIALPPGTNWVFRSLTVPAGIVFEIQSMPGTAPAYADEVASKLRILDALTVSEGGTLSANHLGYLGRFTEGFGEGAGVNRSGAGYGGRGGAGSIGLPGDTHGSAVAPGRIGSGGGFGHTTASGGGTGGGALLLDVEGTLTVDGKLTAAGEDTYYRAGGGSGGAIWLKAPTIAGSGLIAADGGNAHGGGGGGGRIAFDTPQNLFAGTIRASGGTGDNRGHNGTFNFVSDPSRDLVIGEDIALAPGTNWVFRSLTVLTNTIFEIQSIPGTAPDYAEEKASSLQILDFLTVAAGGRLSADGLGYLIGRGPEAGTLRSGSGYGGAGGLSPSYGTPGGVYGSAATADRLGSGGGRGHWEHSGGAAGGGALLLDVSGTLTVDGILSAHGLGSSYRSGGGSGGSIRLRAARIAGSGLIAANGGAGQGDSGGGGGGGRIRMDYGWIGGFERRPEQIVEMLDPAELPETLTFSGAITAVGGPGDSDSDDGEGGTILFRHVPFPLKGTVILLK